MKKSSLNVVKASTLAITICLGVPAMAQQTTGNIVKQNNIKYGVGNGTTAGVFTGGAIKVIDNKGTVKYLQAQNGMTILTNTSNDITTTTWQLGGQLENDTYIDVNGKKFGLDGLTLVPTSEMAATAGGPSVHDGTNGSGWTVLVRDELTGEIKKILAADLLNVIGGRKVITVATGADIVSGTAAQSVDVGYPSSAGSKLNVQKVSVYRNGIKLVGAADQTITAVAANVDYAINNGDATSPNNVLFDPATSANDWSFMDGDVIEIQWVK